MSPTPSQLLRPTHLVLASLRIADQRPRKQRHAKPTLKWLSRVTTARFGVYHSIEA